MAKSGKDVKTHNQNMLQKVFILHYAIKIVISDTDEYKKNLP